MEYSIRGSVWQTKGEQPKILGTSVIGVCPHCGVPWFSLEVVENEWRGFTVACPDCPPWPFEDTVPGSILSTIGIDMLDKLPLAVLRHEFQVHMKFYQRSQNGN